MRVDLVERFAEWRRWPTSKKVALIGLSTYLPFWIVQVPMAHWLLGSLDAYDLSALDFVALLGAPITAGICVAALVLARLGKPGEWTFYAYATSVFVNNGIVVHAFGSGHAATTFLLLTLAIVIVALFDFRKSLFGLGFVAVVLVVLAVVTLASGEYAPSVINRSIDVFLEPAHQVVDLALFLGALALGGALMLVVNAAAERDRDRLDDAVALISQYVPAEVASGILSGSETADAGYRRQKVTAFFSDIVGFTDLSEELEPEDLAIVLNEYFTEMAEIAERHDGTVDELQGDGLVLVFGAPTHVSDHKHALDAVRCAVEMQSVIPGLNTRWRKAGIGADVQVRFGINTGVVTVGHFGSGGRKKYSILGKHVNLAARIQAMCEPGKILISGSTHMLVEDNIEANSMGEHPFKGITRPVEVFEVAPA